jgi:hypothetical protein
MVFTFIRSVASFIGHVVLVPILVAFGFLQYFNLNYNELVEFWATVCESDLVCNLNKF